MNKIKRQDLVSYLRQYAEDLPEWLKNYHSGDEVPFSQFMSGRIAYYPGCGFDGCLIKVGNMSHCVHSFLQVDYLTSREEMEHNLKTSGIRGYHVLGKVEWTENDLWPEGEYPLDFDFKTMYPKDAFHKNSLKFYCFMLVMERDDDKNEDWGAKRIAVTFLLADGISTYYQLFVRQYNKAPWICLLQDHGFGGNYDRFGHHGLLDLIIRQSAIFPEYILCASNTSIWDNYTKIENVAPVEGGMHRHLRWLYHWAKADDVFPTHLP